VASIRKTKYHEYHTGRAEYGGLRQFAREADDEDDMRQHAKSQSACG
jgi:hypothetical protein